VEDADPPDPLTLPDPPALLVAVDLELLELRVAVAAKPGFPDNITKIAKTTEK